jgi:L-asparagine transporter-like permease
MAATGVPGAAGVMNFVVLAAALSAMNSQLYTSTRMMFSLARAGQAPARFGRLNGQGAPAWALALSSAGIAVAAVLNALWPDQAFALMIAVSMFGAMFTWLMIFVTHVAFRRKTAAADLPFRLPGQPWGSVLGAGLMGAVLLTTAFTGPFRLTLAYGVPFLAVLVVAWKLRVGRAPQPRPAAG